MADLPKVAELTPLVSFLAPGFIILGIRNRYKGSSEKDVTKGLILYAVASSAYYAAISPFFSVSWGLKVWPWLWAFLQFFAVPLIIGILFVAIDQTEWFYKFSQKFKLEVGHHIPTAWDWSFKRKRPPSYVTVRLKDGLTLHGVWTDKSFASSSASERDIYLDRAWSVNEQGAWAELDPPRSLLICSKDIISVEFIGG